MGKIDTINVVVQTVDNDFFKKVNAVLSNSIPGQDLEGEERERYYDRMGEVMSECYRHLGLGEIDDCSTDDLYYDLDTLEMRAF